MPANVPPKYPEHGKLKALTVQKEAVQAFIDWLYDDAELLVAERGEYVTGGEYLYPVMQSREALMAWHFDIDLRKLDDEKRAMLDECRKVAS